MPKNIRRQEIMTEDEGIEKLIEFCDAEIKKSGWWIFKDKKLTFAKTKLLKQYEREANLSLPESLQIQNVVFNNIGLTINGTLYQWNNIVATGIKTHAVPISGIPEWRFDEYFLFCLQNGKVIEFPLGDIKHLHGQLGHFVEQYKLGGHVSNV